MRQAGIALLVIVLLIAVGIYVVRNVRFDLLIAKALMGPLPSAEEMYPPSPDNLPPPVATPLSELLTQYQAILVKLGVQVESDLQKGLTDEELDKIEAQYQVQFSSDIRELYKWHNGTPESCSTEVFPWGRFLPIDYALKVKNLPSSHPDPEIQKIQEQMIAFRRSWIPIIEDASGNGYYFDPDRATQSSSFFYHPHDDISYHFYPSVANYIQSLIDMDAQGYLVYNDQSVQMINPDIVAFVNPYGKLIVE